MDGCRVRYYETGDGPPVLLLHGAGATARFWKPLADRMSPMFRVIAPDLPGFGGSQMPGYINSVSDYSRFVLKFLDALGIDRASVVGSSMGGWVACWFAVDFPGRVAKLVLISPAGLYFEEKPPMPVDDIIKGIEAACDELGEAAAEDFRHNAETIKTLVNKGGFEPDLIQCIREVRTPTLIIWGSDDPVIPPEYAGAFMAAINGSALQIIEGAGHVPQSERPDETMLAIKRFIDPAWNTGIGAAE